MCAYGRIELLTFSESIDNPPLRLDVAGRDLLQQLLRICRRHHRRVPLPLLVLVRVRIVADATYHEAREVLHQSSRLHLETKDAEVLAQPISQGSALDDLVARGDIAVVSHRACVFAGIPVDCVRAVAVFTTGIGT